MTNASPLPEIRVLVVEDDDLLRVSLVDRLRMEGVPAIAAEGCGAARRLLAGGGIDLVVTDIRLPDGTGRDLFLDIAREHKGIPVILMTAYGTVPDAVELVKAGAHDYLAKPFEADDFVARVRRALDEVAAARSGEDLAAPDGTLFQAGSGYLGKSPAMRQIERLIKRVAPLGSSVLITGEPGVGKGVVADLIHRNSGRAGAAFVTVNCAGIPAALAESELFGHEKDALPGVTGQRIGRLEKAAGGTVLIDEIDQMPLELQGKLLRVMQEGVIERTGSNQSLPVDVRVLACGQRDLRPAMEQGRFRGDLFWRLNAIHIDVPPLRSRPEDILFLARRFVAVHAAAMNPEIAGLSPEAEARLLQYAFPGNVRELKNLMETAVALCEGRRVEAHDIEALPAAAGKGGAVPLRDALDGAEQEAIRTALESSRGAIGHAAELLGISRKSLWEKMRRHGIGRTGRYQGA